VTSVGWQATCLTRDASNNLLPLDHYRFVYKLTFSVSGSVLRSFTVDASGGPQSGQTPATDGDYGLLPNRVSYSINGGVCST
jgi:hypothetical protein